MVNRLFRVLFVLAVLVGVTASAPPAAAAMACNFYECTVYVEPEIGGDPVCISVDSVWCYDPFEGGECAVCHCDPDGTSCFLDPR